MEDDIIILKCNNCGEEFLYQTHKGKGCKNLPKYCDNCKLIKQKENKQRYIEKRKQEKAELKTKRITNKDIDEFANKENKKFAKRIIRTPVDANEEIVMDKYAEFIQTISELLMTLDSTRVKLCEVAKQMSEYQSGYDKSDQTYLHKLENLNTEDLADMKRFVVEWKMSRGARRNVKDLITLVGSVIDAIPFKNYANAIPILKGNAFKPKI